MAPESIHRASPISEPPTICNSVLYEIRAPESIHRVSPVSEPPTICNSVSYEIRALLSLSSPKLQKSP